MRSALPAPPLAGVRSLALAGTTPGHRAARVSFHPVSWASMRPVNGARFPVVAPLLLACGPSLQDYQHASSGPTGCRAQEIAISDQDIAPSGQTGSWTAVCNGKTYRCSAVGTNATCSPAQ